jgi:hypothetical protein
VVRGGNEGEQIGRGKGVYTRVIETTKFKKMGLYEYKICSLNITRFFVYKCEISLICSEREFSNVFQRLQGLYLFKNHVVCLKYVANNLSSLCYILCHLNVFGVILKLPPVCPI